MLHEARGLAELAVAVELDRVLAREIPELVRVLLLFTGVRVSDPREDRAVVDPSLDAAAACETAALRHGDELLDERLDGLRLGDRGLDLTVLEEARSEVAEHRAAVIFLHAELLTKDTVTHDLIPIWARASWPALIHSFAAQPTAARP